MKKPEISQRFILSLLIGVLFFLVCFAGSFCLWRTVYDRCFDSSAHGGYSSEWGEFSAGVSLLVPLGF
ncbi:MAG: hypothetical protein ABIH04_02475 [Planctomycetota bacterium]